MKGRMGGRREGGRMVGEGERNGGWDEVKEVEMERGGGEERGRQRQIETEVETGRQKERQGGMKGDEMQ